MKIFSVILVLGKWKVKPQRYHYISNRFMKMKVSDDIKFWRGSGTMWTLIWKQSLWKTLCPSLVSLKICTLSNPAIVPLNIHLCWLFSIFPPNQQPFSTLLHVTKVPRQWRSHHGKLEGGRKEDEVGYLFLHVPFCSIITCWVGPLTKGHNLVASQLRTAFSALCRFWSFFPSLRSSA